jgi:large subunit ribosomal protein L17
MRHQRKTVKLGRTQAHRDSLLANQVCSLIEHSRIETTLAKAKAVRPLAEKMVTLGKKKTLHARRTALATLRHNRDAVKRLFDEVAPRAAARNGGYTRIIKLGFRKSDAAPMAFIEWVDRPVIEEEPAAKPEKKTPAKKPTPTPATPGETAQPAEKAEKKPASKGAQAGDAGAEKKQTRKPRGEKSKAKPADE